MAEESIIKKHKRSPAYPSYGLKKCVQFISLLYKRDGLAEVPKEFAIQHMGLDPKKNYRAASSITGFGLLEERGPMDKRVLKFTEWGKSIVMLKNENAQKMLALQQAATNYDIIKQLCEKWPSDLPANDVIKLELVNRGFTERAAGDFVPVLRDTYVFAGLGERAPEGDNEPPTDGLPAKPPTKPKQLPDETSSGFERYILTLGTNKEVRLFTSAALTQDDIDFMIQWIKRLDLKRSKQIEQLSLMENESESKNEQEPDIPF